MDYDPNSAVIGIPLEAPDTGVMREGETAIEMLERVKTFNQDWVRTGHRSGSNFNNVSATVSIKDEEWNEVGDWMWENRFSYSGLSVLPYDGGTYRDAPFMEIDGKNLTLEDYERKLKYITENKIDLTKIIEEEDTTDLAGELACVGGSCEII